MTISIAERDALWNEFLRRWPLESLQHLTLEQYSEPGNADSFCNWLESRTTDLGSVWGGSSFKFGVYARTDKQPKESSGGRCFDEHYGWMAKYGATPQAAFSQVKAEIIKLANVARLGDLTEVDGIDLGEAIKWKLAFLYQDRVKLCIVPLYKSEYIRLLLNTKERKVSKLQAQLVALKGDENLWLFAERQWATMRESIASESLMEASMLSDTQSEKRIPLNQILFGPPGTGKTFSTIEATLEILDPNFLIENIGNRVALKARFDEFISNQDVRFVTFHQSLSYEDFVEGLAATTDDGKISYEVKPGIFKQLCDAALAKVIKRQDTNINLAGKRIWKMSLGNTQGDDDYIFQECIEQNRILLGYGDELDFSHCKDRAAVHEHFVASGRTELSRNSYEVTAVSTLVSRMSIGDMVVVSEGNYKFRAIGEITSGYQFIDRNGQDNYNQSRSVRWLRVYQPGLPSEQLMNNAFSQMTLYELRDTSINHDKLRALFSDPQEENNKPRSKVLIIDEINRGNIAKIFGELITLIEPSKRKVVDPKNRGSDEETLEVVLPYSKTTFSVPNNVYIIGTMNTSDRSLAGLDIALRRRFVFKEMPPKYDDLRKIDVAEINIGELLNVMNQRIEVLLGRDYCLGHAYFMSLTNESNIDDLAAIFQKQIFPLLQEYFFEDWQRIQWVLNDHNKKSLKFIERKDQSLVQELFGSELPIAESQLPWTINEEAFVSADAYKGIIKAVNP
jgi:5-methylcytosine-specific restriction protein B